MSAFGTLKAAQLLADAHQTGHRLQGLPGELAPADMEQGYAIQFATAALRGGGAAAFKIGLTNTKAQQALGAVEPIAGQLTRRDLWPSASRIATPRHHLRVVEAEIVFEIGKDLSPAQAPFSESVVIDSIAAAYAGLEICDSRFSNGDELSLAHLVADNSNADVLVVGEPIADWSAASLADLPVMLTLGDHPTIQGSTARVLGNPVRSAVWLANWLAARGETLRRGQLISSGSCTGIAEAAQGDRVLAIFGAGASASAEFLTSAEQPEVQ